MSGAIMRVIPADKGTHIIGCALITHVVASALIPFLVGTVYTLSLTAAAIVTATVLKELVWDKAMKRGTPDPKDALANAIGWVLGVWGYIATDVLKGL